MQESIKGSRLGFYPSFR